MCFESSYLMIYYFRKPKKKNSNSSLSSTSSDLSIASTIKKVNSLKDENEKIKFYNNPLSSEKNFIN